MFAIIGATGKVGYATSVALREAGVPVRAVLRDASKAAGLREIGCEIALADLQDSKALAKAIGDAAAVQVIVPPAPQQDTAKQMRAVIENLVLALEETRPKTVLAVSDYGAHIAHDIGMPTLCRTIEQRLSTLGGHKVFLRSAEHMQGWGRAIPAAIASGTLPSFHDPADMLFPTISAPDVGLIAADLLLRSNGEHGVEVVHAEGPRRYSANDVAAALSELSGRKISITTVPRTEWSETFGRVMSPSLGEFSSR
jgi:NAD(P)H dehydrogenase (quinone)